VKGTVMSPARTAIAIVCCCVLVCAGCSKRPANDDLYVYDALDAAMGHEDPAARIERLRFFTADHSGHPARVNAIAAIMTTMAVDMNDPGGALSYIDGAIGLEKDPGARAELVFRKFEYLWDSDRAGAMALAREITEGEESDFRLHLYLCYYLMGEDDCADPAERCFEKLLALDVDSYRNSHARSVFAEFLSGRGRTEEALGILEGAAGYPFAASIIGSYMLEKGETEKAVEAYIAYVSGVPGAGKSVKMDSLYSAVYPGRGDLQERLAAARLIDEGILPDMEFSDLHGKTHRLSSYRGKRIVISAWSPT